MLNKGLGHRVGDSGTREEAHRGRCEANATLQSFVAHLVEEVVCQSDVAHGVRFNILQVGIDGRLVESLHHQITGIVEHDLHINVLAHVHDLLVVIITRGVIRFAKVYTNYSEFLVGES